MAENRELALVLKLVADQFQSELKNSQGALGQFNSFLKDWKTQLTAAGAALFAITKSTANFGEEALKGAQKAGTTVEQFSALSYAAKLADVDNQQLIVGLKSLSQNMVEAARQTGDGEALFRRLGVAALDASGKMRPTEQVLLEVADVFSKAADGAGKTEAAVKLFGKAGVEMIPFLNQGKAGIAELMAEAQRLGVVLSKEDAEAANRFNDELKRLQAAMRGVTLEAGKPLLGVLTEFIELFRSLANTGVAQFFFKGLAEQASLLTGFIKELAANFEFLFGKFTFDQLRTEIARIEAETQARLLLLENPTAGQYVNGPAGGSAAGGGGKPEIAVGTDQEKLGKAKLEIFLAQQRAIDIANQQRTEGADAYTLSLQRQIQLEDIEAQTQEQRGQAIVRQTQVEVAIREAAASKEREDLVQNAQAWLAYGQQVGMSTELRYAKEMELIRANLAQRLDLNVETASRLLVAWQNSDQQLADDILNRTRFTEQEKETVMLGTLARVQEANNKASDDIFAGWARGMEKYVEDTKSGFGMAADMARRTAQAMEQGFRNFFFDLFDGKIKSLKDILKGVLDFVKQIAAQIAAQLAVKAALSAFGFGANAGGMIVQRFATGGPVLGTGNRDTVPALLTPGEYVLSRKDVADIRRGIISGSPAAPNITVNIQNAPADSSAVVNQRRLADGIVLDVIFRNRQGLRPLLGGL